MASHGDPICLHLYGFPTPQKVTVRFVLSTRPDGDTFRGQNKPRNRDIHKGGKCGGGPSPGVQYPGILARGLGLDPGSRPILGAPRPAPQGQSRVSWDTGHRASVQGGEGGPKNRRKKSSQKVVCLVWKMFPHPGRVFLSYLELRSAHIRQNQTNRKVTN